MLLKTLILVIHIAAYVIVIGKLSVQQKLDGVPSCLFSKNNLMAFLRFMIIESNSYISIYRLDMSRLLPLTRYKAYQHIRDVNV